MIKDGHTAAAVACFVQPHRVDFPHNAKGALAQDVAQQNFVFAEFGVVGADRERFGRIVLGKVLGGLASGLFFALAARVVVVARVVVGLLLLVCHGVCLYCVV